VNTLTLGDGDEKATGGVGSGARLSLEDAVSRFYFLAARDVLRMGSFRRRQDLRVEPLAREDCHLLLFISHRWETPGHPDPTGRQLGALKALIHLVCDACDALSAQTDEERARFLPSLRRYGALQALLLVSRLSPSVLTLGSSIDGKRALEWLPNHIGIWYDFACLPQSPRSSAQEREFQAALLAWPDLLLSEQISLIAVRDEGDDYESRGWCFTEARLSSGSMVRGPLALRLDRLGTMSSPIKSAATSQSGDAAATRFRAALDAWEGAGAADLDAQTCWKIVVAQASIAPDSLPLAEEDSPVLSLDRMVRPSVTWVALLMADLLSNAGRVVSVYAAVLSLLKEKGLRCSDDRDLVYVGLLALLWSCNEQSRLAEFFRQCLARHINNDGLAARVTVAGGFRPNDGRDAAGRVNTDDLLWEFAGGE
jgi:hypothetical protein